MKTLALLLALTAAFAPVAYETLTHQELTLRAARRSASLQAFLDASGIGLDPVVEDEGSSPAYVKIFEDSRVGPNLDIVRTGRTAIDIIGYGAVVEDVALRVLNHFLDGSITTPTGLNGVPLVPDGLPSSQWGHDASSNEHNWTRALQWAKDAVVGREPADRREARVELFRSLGQVVHLVQDACQPAHARNDAHPPFVPGQKSVVEAWGGEHLTVGHFDATVSAAIEGDSAPLYFPTFDQYFRSAATFSNSEFFSDDTIWHHFTDPLTFQTRTPPYATPSEPADTVTVVTKPGAGPLGVGETAWVRSRSLLMPGTSGPPEQDGIPLAIRKRSLIGDPFIGSSPLHNYSLQGDDDVVSRSNTVHLLPRAVRLSTGLMEHFFRGRMEAEILPAGGFLRMTNTSDPDGSTSAQDVAFSAGTLTLYYETVSGLVLTIPSVAPVSVPNLAKDDTLLVQADLVAIMQGLGGAGLGPDLRARDDRRVVLLYEGVIGQEPGVAVAEVFPALCTLCAMDTGGLEVSTIADITGDDVPGLAVFRPQDPDVTTATVSRFSVVAANSCTEIWFRNGVEDVNPFFGSEAVSLASDMDGDDIDDLIVQSYVDLADIFNPVVVHELVSGGTGNTLATFSLPSAGELMVLGNFDLHPANDFSMRSGGAVGFATFSSVTGALIQNFPSGTGFIDPTDIVSVAPDWDGDGRLDLLIEKSATGDTRVASSLTGNTLTTVNGYSKVVALPDVTTDGLPDFAAFKFPDSLVLIPGGSSNPKWSNPATTTRLSRAGDFDGDGTEDVVASLLVDVAPDDLDWRFWVFSGVDGKMLWTWVKQEVTSSQPLRAGDVNKDGKSDLYYEVLSEPIANVTCLHLVLGR